MLKAQLQAVATNLSNNIRPWLFQEVKDGDISAVLSSNTLYVPASLLMSFNAFNGKEKVKAEDVFAGYAYKYKICTDAELYKIFQTEGTGRLLFEYVKSSTDKFITIYDLQQKKIIYKEYTAVSYNLHAKDIQKIR